MKEQQQKKYLLQQARILNDILSFPHKEDIYVVFPKFLSIEEAKKYFFKENPSYIGLRIKFVDEIAQKRNPYTDKDGIIIYMV